MAGKVLTEREVIAIRRLYALQVLTQTELAKAFQVSPQTIHHIIWYVTWKETTNGSA